MDQQRRQLEVLFYFKCCIMRSWVGLLAREIRLAMTVVVESWITHYSLDPVVLLFGLSVFHSRNIFQSLVFKCLNSHLKLHCQAIYSMQNHNISWLSDSVLVALQMMLKQVNFCHIIFDNATFKVNLNPACESCFFNIDG